MPGINLDVFRKNLNIVRNARQISAKTLAEDCGMKQLKRISDIEEGRGSPTLEEVCMICTKLNVSIDHMLSMNAKINITFL